MADDADVAQSRTERHIQAAVSDISRSLRTGTHDKTSRRKIRCEDCDDPIPRERLKVVPNAVRCITCAELNERWKRA